MVAFRASFAMRPDRSPVRGRALCGGAWRESLALDWDSCRSSAVQKPRDPIAAEPRSVGLGAALGRRSGRGCSGTRSGRAFAAWGFGLGLSLRFLLGRRRFCRSCFRRCAAFRGVVVHIPSRTLEAQAGHCKSPLQSSAALRTDLLRLGAEVLDFLKSMAALRAAIRIHRQRFYPLGKESSTLPIVPGGRQILSETRRPRPVPEIREIRNSMSLNGH